MRGLPILSKMDPKVPVTILTDSAASHSVILEGVHPLLGDFSTHAEALARRSRMQFVGDPLHDIKSLTS